MKKINLCFALLFIAILSSASSVTFAGNGKPGSGPNPYRDCGIGAALFPETHWAAISSNVIWDIGTTAVTSATASPETCSGANIETAQFIIDNYDNLIEETAKGQGEYLTTVLDIKGCSAKMQDDAIVYIRSDMTLHVGSKYYSEQNQIEKASDYYDAVSSALSSSCSS